MNEYKRTFKISGMSCTSCERTITNALKNKKGIDAVSVSYEKGTADITFDSGQITEKEIRAIIDKAGYTVKQVIEPGNLTSETGKKEIFQLIGVSLFLLAAYLIIANTIGFNFIPQVNSSMGYGILFGIGLLTSLHCVVMCGGINISQSIDTKANVRASNPVQAKKFDWKRFQNSFLYNAGRVVSYTIIGGIAGTAGSVLSLSIGTKGVITIAAGIMMAVIGLKMIGAFSFLRRFHFPAPKFLQKLSKYNVSRYGPFAVGLLNGLMPCGPLQGMQLYALGSGSFFSGALSMFTFSMGTVPLMFGLGSLVTFLSRKFTNNLVRAGSLLVIFLGLVMVNRGVSLTGGAGITLDGKTKSVASVKGGIQDIRSTFTSSGYAPIVVQKGVPVRWIISIKADDLNGCNKEMIVPAYNIDKKLQPGENIVEFTPTSTGTIGYSCWMGMIRSSITVVDNPNNTTASGTGTNTFQPPANTTADIFIAKPENGLQVVEVKVGSSGYSPTYVVLQKGIKAQFKFVPQQLTSCNYRVIFPEYQGQLDLSKGQFTTPQLNVSSDFHFMCGMGMLNAYVKVVDDVNKIDLKQIQNEAANIPKSSGAGCCGSGGALPPAVQPKSL